MTSNYIYIYIYNLLAVSTSIIYKSTLALLEENDSTYIFSIYYLYMNIFKNVMVVTLQKVLFKCVHIE